MKAIETLDIEVRNDKLAHAYLFIGGDDQENQQILDFFINKKKCLREDLIEIRPTGEVGKAGEIKVEAIRDLIHTIGLSPSGESKIAALYNCEKLNSSSGNILLKNLEEPPRYLVFLLFASKASVLPTISSRCRVINLKGKNEEGLTGGEIEAFYDKNFFEASKKIEEIVNDGMVAEFLENTMFWLREQLLKTKDAKMAKELENLELYKKSIENNSNARLVLECVFLRIKKIL